MEQVSKYFNEEKAESILFIVVGIIAIVLSLYFLLKIKQPFYNGLSYSLIIVALIQLTVGMTIYIRSPKDVVRVNQIILTDQEKVESEEIPRMKTVMKSFVLYRWVEISLMLGSVVLFLYFQPMTIWKGFGLGLFIQATIILALDYFAESRGKLYLIYLQSLG